jgi:hypothetical protein
VTEAAGALGIPKIYGAPAPTDERPNTDDVEAIKAWIIEADSRFNWPMTRKEVKKLVFGDIGGQNNATIQQADLQVAMNMHLLEESTVKKNGYYLLQPGQDLPF